MSINSVYDCVPNAESDSTESRRVLIFDTEEGWLVGHYCHEYEMWFSYPDGNELFDATHWQELPEPPK